MSSIERNERKQDKQEMHNSSRGVSSNTSLLVLYKAYATCQHEAICVHYDIVNKSFYFATDQPYQMVSSKHVFCMIL